MGFSVNSSKANKKVSSVKPFVGFYAINSSVIPVKAFPQVLFRGLGPGSVTGSSSHPKCHLCCLSSDELGTIPGSTRASDTYRAKKRWEGSWKEPVFAE